MPGLAPGAGGRAGVIMEPCPVEHPSGMIWDDMFRKVASELTLQMRMSFSSPFEEERGRVQSEAR